MTCRIRAFSERKVIDKTKILYAICAIAQFSRSSAWMKTISIWDTCMTLIQCFCFLFFLYKKVRKAEYTFLDLGIVLFYFMLFISTLLTSKDYTSWLTYMVQGIGSVFLMEDLLKRDRIGGLLLIRNIAFIFIFLNLLTLIFTPMGLNSSAGYFFLGARIGFTPFVLFSIVTSVLCDYEEDYTLSSFTFGSILVGLLNLLIPMVATGLITLMLLILFISYERVRNLCGKYRANCWIWLIVAIMVTLFALFFSQIEILNYFFSWFGKDNTFHGRTIIWHDAEYYIMQRPVWGYGVTGTGAIYVFSYVIPRMLPAHNEVLNLLYQGGFMTGIAFMGIFVVVGQEIKQQKNRRMANIGIISIFTFICLMITEIQTQKAVIFLLIAMIYQLAHGGKNA